MTLVPRTKDQRETGVREENHAESKAKTVIQGQVTGRDTQRQSRLLRIDGGRKICDSLSKEEYVWPGQRHLEHFTRRLLLAFVLGVDILHAVAELSELLRFLRHDKACELIPS